MILHAESWVLLRPFCVGSQSRELVKLPPCSQQCATPQSSYPTLVLVIDIYLPVRSRHYT